MLADGTYNVLIVDANDDARDATLVHLALTVIDGAHKSGVVTIVARDLARDSVDLLGLPGTLTVRDGAPSLRIEE